MNKKKQDTAKQYTSFPPDQLVEEYYKYKDVPRNPRTGKISYLQEQLTGRIKNSLSGFLRVCLVALLALLQLLLLIYASILLQGATVHFYVLLEIASIIIMLALMNGNGSPSYRMAWISIILVFPVTGHLMYYLWGTTRGRKKLDRFILQQIEYGNAFLEEDEELLEDFAKKNPTAGRMAKYMSSENFPLFSDNEICYFPMGELAFEEIFEEMEKAEHFILIEFFIVAEGAIWDKMHDILLRKIREGVEVKFLYDDFGAAIRTNKNFKKKLEEEGFEVAVFNPIHRYIAKLYMNYRTHQKIVVIDGVTGFTGGFNIADEYANLVERFGVWKDTGVKVEGEAVWGLTVVFLQMWDIVMEKGDTHIDYERYKADSEEYLTKRLEQKQEEKMVLAQEGKDAEEEWEQKGSYVQVLSDGPANNPDNPIENVYSMMIQNAGQYLYIMTPYLLIEDAMKDALLIAVKRGVDVRIITPAIPDKMGVNLLTKYNYGDLLRGGVHIYEYTPGFIHAKGIMNEESAIVGTINMDFRSFYLHYENGVWMHGGTVQKTIYQDYMDTFALSREISYEEWKNRPLWMKVVQPIWNIFATLM